MSTLDLKGLKCPMPLLKTRQALNRMVDGEELEVLATDPGSLRDIQTFARQSGHELIEHRLDDDVYYYRLRCRSDGP